MPRALWKGVLDLGALTCPVSLYSATATSQRISFHTINRATGHRVHRRFVDIDTGEDVDRDAQVKGYEKAAGSYVVLEPEEVAQAVPESDKRLALEAFIPCAEVETVYFDQPYFLAPADSSGEETFVLLREGMRKAKVAALTRAVLFRRVRTLMLRPDGPGFVATTLNFDYEVKSAADAFADVPRTRLKGEMLELAEHIIRTKAGHFDPSAYENAHEAALAELVKAKLAGKAIKPRAAPKSAKVVDLMSALRDSARLAGQGADKPAPGPAAKSSGSGTLKTTTKATTKKTAAKTTKSATPRRKAS
ncbi:Ku protein [Aquabacter sp. L1I39]|uniref:non-homologous end joining protein Ku n=1 Tax=Aquabacter sp. L1I39 TaxID=2820278 RepID=UPI001ADD5C01|nr:Ku protein [Aquabacter sp. L1I39]QTL01640.1 Ku protein [Aquabacter sp. L1I39]